MAVRLATRVQTISHVGEAAEASDRDSVAMTEAIAEDESEANEVAANS